MGRAPDGEAMLGSALVGVSVGAAATLLVVFFGLLRVFRRIGAPQMFSAFVAPLLAGAAWFGAVDIGHRRGWARTDEAFFHHLYVLGVVGLPIVGLVLALFAWRRPHEPAYRRTTATIAALFVLPAFVGIWATHIEPNWLRVDRAVVTTARAGAGEPVRIGVIADIQTDRFGSYELAAIDRVMAEAPDLIVVVGDTTQVPPDAYPKLRIDEVNALSRLRAPFGVYSVEGNTDPRDAVAGVAAEAGLRSLVDEVVLVEVRGRRLRIGGLAWPNNQRYEARGFTRDFAEGSTADTIDVLLAHSPDALLHLDEASGIDLVISGHTHGGQIALPLVGPMWNVTELPSEVAGGGLHDVNGTPIYVSTGVGVNRGESPKVRFGVRPSIGIVTIR